MYGSGNESNTERTHLPRVTSIPDKIPNIEISPYSLSNPIEVTIENWKERLSQRFNAVKWCILPRATTGLIVLRKHLRIERISILTTFDTHYISGCVLQAFEGARIIRELDPHADAVMVIHEWGKPLPNIMEVKEWTTDNKIPLIEDCALTMRSDLGIYGDYILYSFPKVLPMDSGGLLIGLASSDLNGEARRQVLDEERSKVLGPQFVKHISDIEENFIRRRQNWFYLRNAFSKAGMEPYFEIDENDVPYIFMLSTNRSEELSMILKGYGIEAGVYWKNDGLFLPCHQELTKDHLDYIAGVVLGNVDKCGRNKQ